MRTVHLRVEFNSYEKSFLIQHLKSYLSKIRRYKPTTNLNTPSMTTHHEIVQFDTTPEAVISAFQLFQLKISQARIHQASLWLYLASYL